MGAVEKNNWGISKNQRFPQAKINCRIYIGELENLFFFSPGKILDALFEAGCGKNVLEKIRIKQDSEAEKLQKIRTLSLIKILRVLIKNGNLMSG